MYRGLYLYVYFFKKKTSYEMRISDWRSDVCSSDLAGEERQHDGGHDEMDGPAGHGRPSRPSTWSVPVSPRDARRTTRNSARSEERRVGKEWGSTCRTRGTPYHQKENKDRHETEIKQ